MFWEQRALLTRAEIIKLKNRALRRGLWYRSLARAERACLDLAVKVVEKVRSGLLLKVLYSIINKISELMESQVTRLMREVGCGLAEKLCAVAHAWGNRSALNWIRDPGFIQYLTISHLNSSR